MVNSVGGSGQTPQFGGEHSGAAQISPDDLAAELKALKPYTQNHITTKEQLSQIIQGDMGVAPSASLVVVLDITKQVLTQLKSALKTSDQSEIQAATKAIGYLIPSSGSSAIPNAIPPSNANIPGTNLLSEACLATYFDSGVQPSDFPPDQPPNITTGSAAVSMVILMLSAMVGQKNQMTWIPEPGTSNGGYFELTKESSFAPMGFNDHDIDLALKNISTAIENK